MQTMQTTTVLTPGGQLAGGVPVQNVVIIPSYGEARIWTNYASKTSLKLGVTQIIIGVLCIVFNITAIAEHVWNTSFGPGIFGGLFFILTGAFGTMAARHKTSCPILAFMVLSIVAVSIFVLPLLIFSALGLIFQGYYARQDEPYRSIRDSDAAVAMNALLLILSVVEAVVGIWSAALGCRSMCCGRRSQSGVVMQQVPMVMDVGTTQVMYTAGPPAMYPQTGNVGQQQVYPCPDRAPQPQPQLQPPMIVPPPQYGGASSPPPYEFSAPFASGGDPSTVPLFPGEEKKMAL